MLNNYWTQFYKTHRRQKESSFARLVEETISTGSVLVDLGCGDGRDTVFFTEQGIVATGVDKATTGESVSHYIKNNTSPEYVYTRFFWHSIQRKDQLAILKWTKGTLFIEARTTEDKKRSKTFRKHKRYYVDIVNLLKDLKDNGFQITSLCEGTGFAKFKKEDPHLVRLIAKKQRKD